MKKSSLVLVQNNLNSDFVYLMPPDRESVKTLLEASKYADVIIPRGSRSLIQFVRGKFHSCIFDLFLVLKLNSLLFRITKLSFTKNRSMKTKA